MAEVFGMGGTPNRNDHSETYEGYLSRAVNACEAGDSVLGMHLYLAAYEKAVVDPAIPDGMALTGLREAWRLACELKERSMAEYVFEKLEPYLTGEEIAACAQQLQNLALDRLEQYGFSRQELEEMAEMISQDFVSDGSVLKVESISIPNVGVVGLSAPQAQVVKASTVDVQANASVPEELSRAQRTADATASFGEDPSDDVSRNGASTDGEPYGSAGDVPLGGSDDSKAKRGKPNQVGVSTAPIDGFNPYAQYERNSIGTSYHAATNEGSGAYVFTRDQARAAAGEKAKEAECAQQASKARDEAVENPPEAAQSNRETGEGGEAALPANVSPEAVEEAKQVAALIARAALDASEGDLAGNAAPSGQSAGGLPASGTPEADVLNFSNLVGFDEAISILHDLGVGLQHDSSFLSFVGMLNKQHGLVRSPALDTLLFRAPVIEDAGRIVEATIGEIGLPVLRMSMEEGMQGVPMLCLTTQGNHRPRMNHAHNRFEAPAILVLENLDTWTMPEMPENIEGMGGFVMANISRGAREAVNLIRSAVEDPDVYVFATASCAGEADPFFYEVLEPLTIVDVGYPNDKERIDIWTEIARNHPSMRMINRTDLMKLSEGLSRYDIYMAAREAIEEAYKIGLVQRAYVPVSPHNIFEKIALCQPLDSDAYAALEDKVIQSFKRELDDLEDLLGGSEA